MSTTAAATPDYIPVMLGVTAAAIVALGVTVPWTVAIWIAAAVFTLSFLENETFILLLTFLLPVGAFVKSAPLLHDLGVAVRLLFVSGFFLGRLCREHVELRKLWHPSVTRASCVFLGTLAISAILGIPGQIQAELRGIYIVGTYVAFYLAMFAWLRTSEQVRKLVLTLMASAVWVCVFAFYQSLTNGYTWLWLKLYAGLGARADEWMGRPPSFMDHPNSLAGYLNLILAFALPCYLLSDDRRCKQLSAWTLAVGIAALMLTQSRGAYIAFGCMLLMAIWHFVKDRRTRLLAVAGVLGLAVSVSFISVQLQPRRFSFEGDNSLLGRILLWNVAWQLFRTSPIHGVGFGTFPSIYGNYLPPLADMPLDAEVHNVYLELLAETGLLGLSGFLCFMYTAFRDGRRQLVAADWLKHAAAFAVYAGILGLLVECFVDHYLLWSPQVGFLLWLWLGVLVASSS